MEGWGPVRYTSPSGASRLSNSGLNRDICTSRNGVTFITTKTSAIICHGNLCRGLDYVPVQALEPITPFGDTSSPSFVHHVPERHSLPRDIGVSAGEVKLELREWLVGPRRCTIPTPGCHCGSPSWFSGCLLQWLMSYFIFFPGLSRKNGAREGSFTAFKSISVPWVSRPLPRKVHIYLMCLTPLFFFSAQFYQTMISTQRYWDTIEAWVSCSLALWSVQEQTCYYISTWNQSNFLQL